VRHAAFAALALACAPSFAAAQDWSDGIYLKLSGGGSYLLGGDASLSDGSRSDVDFSAGYAAGAALGYELTPNISLELEYMYRTGDVDGFSSAGFGADGDFASVIISANVLYQFDGWQAPIGGRLRPFLGAGIGVTQEIDFDVQGGAAAGEYSDSGGFAFQLRAGANWELDANWILSAEARYFDAGEPGLKSDRGGRKLDAQYNGLEALVGLAYRF
jgi:opacity protein-like surface antigen